jgi:hypothetical protein
MAVLLITYKYNPETSKADYDGFYEVIRTYRWTKLSESNYAIAADEPAKAIWQKLKAYIDPDDYLIMLTFKASSWNLKDQKVLAWLLQRPLTKSKKCCTSFVNLGNPALLSISPIPGRAS